MLTDDDLTRQLGAAFRDTTEDLSYAGRVPTPRSAVALGVPLVATAATVATLAAVWAVSPDESDAPAPRVAGPTAAPSAPGPKQIATDTFRIAGLTFAVSDDRVWTLAELRRIQHREIEAVPDGAREVPLAEPAKGWVGTDAETGHAALYIHSPSRFHGRLLAMTSPDLSETEMGYLLRAFVS